MFKRHFQWVFVSLSFLALITISWLSPFRRSNSIVISQLTFPVNPYPFYLGVLEDGNLVGGNPDVFRSLILDVQSRGLDAIMFTNNDSERDAPLLDVSDELNFNVFMIPTADLNRTWWPSEVPANLETALAVANPIVTRWQPHPSLKGYLTKDEPRIEELEKVSLINQAFQMLDPTRPVMPILIGTGRVGPIFNASHADIMLIDVYPVGAPNELCDLTMTGFGSPDVDFVGYIRVVTQQKPASVPLWIILQTHSFLDQLREPIATEVREQHWLAIGEGAKSIFWFIYSSQQGWRGLRDNPELYAEVTALTQRTLLLRDTLLALQKIEDQFTVSGSGSYLPYVSTLISPNNRYFAVAVNRDCQNSQDLVIHSSSLSGQLKDLETATIYDLESAITFLPGDGKIFEFIPEGEVVPTDTSTLTEIAPTATDTPTPLSATETPTLTYTADLTLTLLPTEFPSNTATSSPIETPNSIPTATPVPSTSLPSPNMLYPLLEALLQAVLEQLRQIISFNQA